MRGLSVVGHREVPQQRQRRHRPQQRAHQGDRADGEVRMRDRGVGLPELGGEVQQLRQARGLRLCIVLAALALRDGLHEGEEPLPQVAEVVREYTFPQQQALQPALVVVQRVLPAARAEDPRGCNLQLRRREVNHRHGLREQGCVTPEGHDVQDRGHHCLAQPQRRLREEVEARADGRLDDFGPDLLGAVGKLLEARDPGDRLAVDGLRDVNAPHRPARGVHVVGAEVLAHHAKGRMQL
mmetsp:Transcript_88554/g.264121  ORF Transcript_88554/g.264121 Transcript_88554/m.264121 type:complete len:239 (+) Transcript_88554:325-1041(+)